MSRFQDCKVSRFQYFKILKTLRFEIYQGACNCWQHCQHSELCTRSNVECWNVEFLSSCIVRWMLKCWILENVEMLKCWNLECWNVEILEYWATYQYLNHKFKIFKISRFPHFNICSTFNISSFQELNISTLRDQNLSHSRIVEKAEYLTGITHNSTIMKHLKLSSCMQSNENCQATIC